MKQTLEQRLRGGLFAKLSINRQYIDNPFQEPIPFSRIHEITDGLEPVYNNPLLREGDPAPIQQDPYNSCSVDLPASGAQMHIHEGPTGNYDQVGQSMAHFKMDGSNTPFQGMSSYDAAMGHARAQQMGLHTSSFDMKKVDEYCRQIEQEKREKRLAEEKALMKLYGGKH